MDEAISSCSWTRLKISPSAARLETRLGRLKNKTWGWSLRCTRLWRLAKRRVSRDGAWRGSASLDLSAQTCAVLCAESFS